MNNDEFSDKVKEVFANPQLQKAIINTVTSNRPQGWSRKSQAPYFKERYGRQMKHVFDLMIADRVDRSFTYEEHCKKLNISQNTLALRINQGILYLLQRMDGPDLKYAKFHEMIRVHKKRGYGIIIEFLPEYRQSDLETMTPKSIIAQEQEPMWKERMQKWLEESSPEDDPFVQERLALGAEEIMTYRKAFAGVPGLMAEVTSSCIKLIKV